MFLSAAARVAQHLQGLTPADMAAVSDRAGVPRRIGARARAGRKVCASAYMQLCLAMGIDAVTGAPTPRSRPTGSSIVWWFFGSNLFLARHLRRLDLRSAADIIGVSDATLSRAERGIPIAVENFLRISQFIGMPADSFLSFTENTNCNTLKPCDSRCGVDVSAKRAEDLCRDGAIERARSGDSHTPLYPQAMGTAALLNSSFDCSEGK